MSANLHFIFGNAKLLWEIWKEITNNGLLLLIIIQGTGDGIAWNGGGMGLRGEGDEKREEEKEREKGKREKGGRIG